MEENQENVQIVEEGKAKIAFSKNNEVFYNPVQEVNRDLSIMMLNVFQQQLKEEKANDKRNKDKYDGMVVLEALSATGLRSIRYFKEVPGIKSIVVNDIDSSAVDAIQRNIEYNGLSTEQLIPSNQDATMLMYQHRESKKQFHVVDLDPYGGVSQFLDGAVQCVQEGGLLCVTCTDLAVLCGNHGETCFGKYGSVPHHTKYSHEMAVRIVLYCISTHAARYKKHIVPILSMQIDFYLRVFVRVYTSANQVKNASMKQSYVYQCTGCESFWTQPLFKANEVQPGIFNKFSPSTVQITSNQCTECDSKLKLGGPIWSAPMHSPEWVEKLITHIKENPGVYKQEKKILGLLTVVKHELHDCPLYYFLPDLCTTLHVATPKIVAVRSAIKNAGYDVSSSHTASDGLKTNAPNNVIWDIMRCWNQENPTKRKGNSPGNRILSKEPKIKADFTMREDAKAPEADIPKFIPNPQPNWGPGTRAGKKRSSNSNTKESEKKTKK